MGEGGSGEGRRKGGWNWCIEKGMKVKMGERLGFVAEEDVGSDHDGKVKK